MQFCVTSVSRPDSLLCHYVDTYIIITSLQSSSMTCSNPVKIQLYHPLTFWALTPQLCSSHQHLINSSFSFISGPELASEAFKKKLTYNAHATHLSSIINFYYGPSPPLAHLSSLTSWYTSLQKQYSFVYFY